MTRSARGLAWCLAVLALAGCGGTSRKELERRAPHGPDDNAAGAAAVPNSSCPFSTLDLSSGVETCDDDEVNPTVSFTHRARVGEGCSFDLAIADTCNLGDCPGPHPFCDEENGEPICGTGCLVDAECGEHEYCACQGPGLGGRCQSTECQTDAECEAGQLCASLDSFCGLQTAFTCQSPYDQCIVSSQCPNPGDQCVPVPSGSGGGAWPRLCLTRATCPSP